MAYNVLNMVREHRRFKRYYKRCPAKISLKNKTHSVEIVDYSLAGIGVILKNSLQISNGDILRIDSDKPSLGAKCTVEWWSKTPHGLRVGLQRCEPLQGSLQDYKLSDIFIGLQRSLKTGVLSVKSGPVKKDICIKNGDMIFASSNQDEDRLGDILLREGRISQEDFDRSSRLIRETGKRQGAILVELGAVTPKDLFWAVKHQVTEIILSLFDFGEGSFVFHEGPLLIEEVITLKLSAGNLIYRGIKRPDCIEQVKDYLTLPPDTLLSFSPNPLNLFQDVSFDEEDKKILSLVDGARSLMDIIRLSGLDDATGRRSIAALLGTSIIEAADERTGDEEAAARETITPEDVLSEPVTSPDVIENIEKLYREYQGLDYYTLLGIDESATDSKIRWAFYRLAKEFHPDRHFYLGEDIKGKLHAIFSQITNAYNVLSSSEKRKKYDRTISRGASRAHLARKKYETGLAEYHKGNFLEASELFREALYLEDSEAAYHFHHGVVLAKLNKPKEAERAMTKASRLDPKNDEILTKLGDLYLSLGFPLRAKRTFMKALELNPSNREASKGVHVCGS